MLSSMRLGGTSGSWVLAAFLPGEPRCGYGAVLMTQCYGRRIGEVWAEKRPTDSVVGGLLQVWTQQLGAGERVAARSKIEWASDEKMPGGRLIGSWQLPHRPKCGGSSHMYSWTRSRAPRNAAVSRRQGRDDPRLRHPPRCSRQSNNPSWKTTPSLPRYIPNSQHLYSVPMEQAKMTRRRRSAGWSQRWVGRLVPSTSQSPLIFIDRCIR